MSCCIALYPSLIADYDSLTDRLRMGVAFGFMGVGGLIGVLYHLILSALNITIHCNDNTGPPINGALLSGDFVWWRPALFSGVRTHFFASSLVHFARINGI
jgi:hypothetical protein